MIEIYEELLRTCYKILKFLTVNWCGIISKFILIGMRKISSVINNGRHKLCNTYLNEELLRKVFRSSRSANGLQHSDKEPGHVNWVLMGDW